MTDYTPTTAQARNAYTRGQRNTFIASLSEHEDEFDRWLETVRHHAWEDGANAEGKCSTTGKCTPNPYTAHPLGPQDGDAA